MRNKSKILSLALVLLLFCSVLPPLTANAAAAAPETAEAKAVLKKLSKRRKRRPPS